MALTKLIGSIITAGIHRKQAGQLDKLLEDQIGNGKVVYFEPAGSDTTTAAGIIDVDHTAIFSAIDAVFVVMTGADGLTQYATVSTSASAGFVRFTVGDETASVDTTAVTYAYIAIGDAV